MSGKIDISKEQNDIYVHIMKYAQASKEAGIKQCKIEHSVSEVHSVAYAKLLQQQVNQYLVTSLPTISNQVYIALTSGHPDPLCTLIARLDAESESNDALVEDHLSVLNETKLKSLGWYGLAITSISHAFGQFPNKSVINDDQIDFFLLVLLTRDEYQKGLKYGIPTLITHFLKQNRPLNLATPPGRTDGQQAVEPSHQQAALQHHARQLTASQPAEPTQAGQPPQPHSDKTEINPHVEDLFEEPDLTELSQALQQHALQQHHEKTAAQEQKMVAKPAPISKEERTQQLWEIVFGGLLIIAGALIGGYMIKNPFPGDYFIPIIFALLGGTSILLATKKPKNSR